MKTKPLSPELLHKMDAYWRAANYLSVGQLYLYDNPLLREPLKLTHVKPTLLGHWGTTPGQNFIYVHLNRVVKKYDLDMIYISGPGHGGPALAQADLGIAIGAGSDVAVETADVILVRSNPLDVVAILKLSRATYRKMVQNLLWGAGYNTFAVPLAAGALYAWGVLLTPALGAVLMSASTVIVAINARLLKIKRR